MFQKKFALVPLCAAAILLLSHLSSFALFTDSGTPLPGLSASRVAWGDFNNDGRLDLAVCGYDGTQEISRIYRNDGQGVLTDIQAGLPGVQQGAVVWGDYDGDGHLDLVVAGKTSSGCVTAIYRNNGNGTFTDAGANLPGIYAGGAAWGDYDNDGDLDLVVTGASVSDSPTTFLCRNDGDSFVVVTGQLPALKNSAVAFGDMDNDGYLDVIIGGNTGSVRRSWVYYNSEGQFSDSSRYETKTGLDNGAIALANCRNSSRLWFATCGASSSWDASTIVYEPALTVYISGKLNSGVKNGNIAWADFDGDGDYDLGVCGVMSAGMRLTRIVINSGSSLNPSPEGLPDFDNGNIAWGDWDNDGDLDLAACGDLTSSSRMCRIYVNDQSTPNVPPTAPTGLTATALGSDITFQWNASSDAQTHTSGLTYNLRVGTTPGADDIVAGMANPTTGFRRIAALGNVQMNLSWTVKNLRPESQAYYWSVQAIDASYAGSPWAAEQVVGTSGSDVTPPEIESVSVNPPLAAPGDDIRITIVATDNNAVASVTADGMEIENTGGNNWSGLLTASSGLGIHAVPVVVQDAAGNTSLADGTYKTVRIVGASCKALDDPISIAAFDEYLFKIWGRVSIVDGNTFSVDDGSGANVLVTSPGYTGITEGCFVSVRGMLISQEGSVSLGAVAENVVRLD